MSKHLTGLEDLVIEQPVNKNAVTHKNLASRSDRVGMNALLFEVSISANDQASQDRSAIVGASCAIRSGQTNLNHK